MTARRLAPSVAVLLLAVPVLLAGCAPAAPKRSARTSVTVAKVERRAVPLDIDASGTVEAVRNAQVVPQVAGVIKKVLFHEGQEVDEGQPLFQIDPAPFEAKLRAAAAAAARSHAQAVLARLDLGRAVPLASQQLLSQGELDQKQAAADAATATAAADSAALASARIDLANATVRAPIAGRTGDARVHEGDAVKAGDPASPVVSVLQIHPIRVRFTLPERQLSSVLARRNQSLEVVARAAGGDTTWSTGTLSFVDNQVDASTGTVLLKGEFANAGARLWPGQFADVRLRLGDDAGATVVPSAAVTETQTGTVVYVMAADSTASPRNVKVARQWRELAVIADGLVSGETVITDGQSRLAPGSRVVVRAPAGHAPSNGTASGASK